MFGERKVSNYPFRNLVFPRLREMGSFKMLTTKRYWLNYIDMKIGEACLLLLQNPGTRQILLA